MDDWKEGKKLAELENERAEANRRKGIHDIADENMGSASKVYITEHGEGPEDCTLVGFGGAGPIHACDLARRIGLGQVLIPSLVQVLIPILILRILILILNEKIYETSLNICILGRFCGSRAKFWE